MELDSGDGRATLKMYLIPQHHTLKMVMMVKSMLRTLLQLKKKRRQDFSSRFWFSFPLAPMAWLPGA